MPLTPPTVIMVNGDQPWGGKREWCEKNRDGMIGSRDYLINAAAVGHAFTGDQGGGLPKVGDAWDASYPLLQVARVRCVPIGGQDDGGTGLGGWTWAHVDYETPRFGGSGSGYKDGDKYTVLETSVSSFQRLFADGATAGALPIANGKGVSCNRGRIRARVVHYKAPSGTNPVVNITTLIQLTDRQKLNSDVVNLPKVQGTQWTITLNPGQIQYVGFDIAQEGNTGTLVRVTHTIDLAEEFLARWMEEDVNGNGTGVEQTAVVYPSQAMAAILQ